MIASVGWNLLTQTSVTLEGIVARIELMREAIDISDEVDGTG
jgi:hypothetical protein